MYESDRFFLQFNGFHRFYFRAVSTSPQLLSILLGLLRAALAQAYYS